MKTFMAVLVALVIGVSGVMADDEPKIDWTTNYDVAMKRMEDQKKPVLVLFTDPVGCQPCKRMEAEVFTDKRVIEKARGFVCCKIIVTREHGQEILARFRQWGQPVNAWPSVRFIRKGNSVLSPDPGFTPADELLGQMRQVQEGK